MKYRPEIDGLRAVAVVPVVLLHAGITGFSGGYVGVDAFFVISGYLITSLIVKEIDAGSFTILGFYERRARRILPALAVVLIACAIASWYLLFPHEFGLFSLSLLAVSTFSSNVLFWAESGYFDAAAHSRPLLHTWSLAVEEQFYIFFPLLLVFLKRFSVNWKLAVLGVGAAGSLAIAFWCARYAPSTGFYLLPSRAWELFLGAIIALGYPRPHNSLRLREVASAAGLLAIAYAVFFFDRYTVVAGLLPCLGVGLLIWSNGNGQTTVGKWMSHRWIVGVGLISYSLYLWHWPTLIFAEFFLDRPLAAGEAAGAIALSVVLAWLSWLYVERPVRTRTVFTNRVKLLGAVTIMTCATIGFGVAGMASNGFENRLPDAAVLSIRTAGELYPNSVNCRIRYAEDVQERNMCVLGSADPGDAKFVLWGDSHATTLMPAFDTFATEHGVWGYLAAHSGCPPLIGAVTVYKNTLNECLEFNEAVFSLIRTEGIENVVLVGRWSVYILGLAEGEEGRQTFLGTPDDKKSDAEHSKDVFRQALADTVDMLSAAGVNVWVFAQVPLQPFEPGDKSARRIIKGDSPIEYGVSLKEHEARQAFANEVIFGLEGGHINAIDPGPYLCTPDKGCRVAVDGRSLYLDIDHMSVSGSIYLKPLFNRLFEKISPSS